MEENKPLNPPITEDQEPKEKTLPIESVSSKNQRVKEKIASLIKYLTHQLKEEDQTMAAIENELEVEPLPSKRKPLIISSCIIIALLMGLVYYQYLNDEHPNVKTQFQAPTISPIESDTVTDLTEFHLDSIQIPLEIKSTDGKSLTQFVFNSPEEIHELLQFKLMKASDQTLLYESKILKPGECLTDVVLSETLLTGSHQILLQLTALDSQSKQVKETKTYAISLLVENEKK